MAVQKTLEIEFVKSPSGLFKLAYHVGDKVKLPIRKAQDIISAGYAVEAAKPSK